MAVLVIAFPDPDEGAIWRLATLGSHMIRHTFAQDMADEGSAASIQDVFGHGSDKIARHYPGQAKAIQAANIIAKSQLAG